MFRLNGRYLRFFISKKRLNVTDLSIATTTKNNKRRYYLLLLVCCLLFELGSWKLEAPPEARSPKPEQQTAG